MYTGMVIDELMEMVARVADHARDARRDELEREVELAASHFAYHATDSQSLLIGVA